MRTLDRFSECSGMKWNPDQTSANAVNGSSLSGANLMALLVASSMSNHPC